MTIWAKRRIHNKICACGCGQNFTTRRSKARFLRGHQKKLFLGEKSDKWKGGITIDRGYVFIYSPKHPRQHGNYVKRSRLTMEKKLGRYLEPWEFVHHINGIKDDDRQENLFLTTLFKHNHIHKPLPKNRWSKKYDFCQKCGRNDTAHQAKGMCHNCYIFQRNHQSIP